MKVDTNYFKLKLFMFWWRNINSRLEFSKVVITIFIQMNLFLKVDMHQERTRFPGALSSS